MPGLSKDQIIELKELGFITHVVPSEELVDNTVVGLKIDKFITATAPSDSIEEAVTHIIPVESVKLSSWSVGLLFGTDGDGNEYAQTTDLYVVPTPANADIESVVWNNSDPTVVSMTDYNGGVLISPLTLGHSTISATVNGDKTGSCSINVIKPMILVKGLTLDKNTASADTSAADATVTLTATITPADATYPGVEWSSSVEGVTFQEVTPGDSSSVVVTIPMGTSGEVVITAKSVNVADITDTCTITATS